jgi:hypothetical protein
LVSAAKPISRECAAVDQIQAADQIGAPVANDVYVVECSLKLRIGAGSIAECDIAVF